ncbi:unnamed protein product, partial [Heligmosomoides polygyrus]
GPCSEAAIVLASELGATFGDAAVSQLVRHAAARVLQEPRIAEITLKTRESPSVGLLAHLDVLNRVSYKNLSVVFHDDSLHVVIDRLVLLSHPQGCVARQTGSYEPYILCHANNFRRFPVYELIPEKLRSYVINNDTTLFYRFVALEVRGAVQAETPVVSLLDESVNTTLLEVELDGDDRVTVWLEDAIINELLEQVDWNFEWMNEQLPVTSPVIPPDSREFLTTLCTECYFQVNVGARGRPSVTATNSSLNSRYRRDRVHLRVVNPDRNLTSVFVSFVLTIQAEVRPSFDGGILRTLVQLLDTSIEMEVGAFPKSWGIFMQDLMRGMIMDMLWPEIKNAIEELSYGKGVRISRACGVDPNEISLEIGEGSFALTSRLALQYLDLDKCLKDLKTSLPSTSKIFQKLER